MFDNSCWSDFLFFTGMFGFSLCFDNVNQKVTIKHQTRDRQNKMFNMVQAYGSLDKIPTLHFDDAIPWPDA